MKTVILCGGLGTRLSEETKKIPKPMVEIGKIPILEHIMRIYEKHGFNEFILALGYKKEKIVNHFKKNKKRDIKFVDTGIDSLTGKRLLKLKRFLTGDENFFLTYGDGLSNIDITKLLNYHKKNKKIATLSAVRPPARFGELTLKKNGLVAKFSEKNQINQGWINGGFFVFNRKVFDYLPKYQCMLEREPITNLTRNKQLIAFKHNGFWQCMDTLRDKILLNKIWKSGKSKW